VFLVEAALNKNVLAAALLASSLTACYAPNTSLSPPRPPPPSTTQNATITYAPSAETFPNPERGTVAGRTVGWPIAPDGKDLATWDFCGSGNNFSAYNDDRLTAPLQADELQKYRLKAQSLIVVGYHLFRFRDQPLSQAFLEQFRADMETARRAGMKVIPLFTYNFAKGGPDAPLQRVLGHLEQLKPFLAQDKDVIAFAKFGWIGCWGEMHTSSNNLVDEQGINDNTRKITDKWLEVMPEDRMITVRYPRYKFQYFGHADQTPIAPITTTEAFQGTPRSRLGSNDECLNCGEWNAGTWWSWKNDAKGIKAFLAKESRYTVHAGEVDDQLGPTKTDEDGDGWTSDYDACDRMTTLFAEQHMSTVDTEGGTGFASQKAFERWRKDGCYDTIAQKLGYRFELVRAVLPTAAQPGAGFKGTVVVKNVGWAAPYNPRGLELILRNKASGKIDRLNVLKERQKSFDPRFWLPEEGEINVEINQALPAGLGAGSYELLLNLPDPAPSLSNRPEYSIQLANKGVWEASTGWNALGATLEVKP
jgi:Domain of unknown function (DUF4832)/Domain of unknown function (DUF4874)